MQNQLSRNNPCFRRYLFSQFESFNFSTLFFHMEEKQTFVKSSDSEILKLLANTVLESTKKSTKYAVNVFGGE